MYTSALFTAILAGSALALHPAHELVRRQTLTPDILPNQCVDTCTPVLPIYNACIEMDEQTCLTVCDEANFDPFVNCFNCIIQNTSGASSGQLQQAQSLVNELEQACGQTASGSGSVTGASSASSGAAASFTSASSGVTIGGASSTGASASVASITSGAGASISSISQQVGGSSTPSASQASASAASSSPNAGHLNAPNGIAAVILGAIGALAL